MALQYKFIGRPKDSDECIELLQNDVIPLMTEHWNAYGKPFYVREFFLNVEGFFNYWMNNGLVIILAYEDNKAVGILIGLRFIPMTFHANILQLETCYGKRAEIEEGLYNYLESISNILDYDELWIATDTIKVLPKNKTELNRSEIVRYKRT